MNPAIWPKPALLTTVAGTEAVPPLKCLPFPISGDRTQAGEMRGQQSEASGGFPFAFPCFPGNCTKSTVQLQHRMRSGGSLPGGSHRPWSREWRHPPNTGCRSRLPVWHQFPGRGRTYPARPAGGGSRSGQGRCGTAEGAHPALLPWCAIPGPALTLAVQAPITGLGNIVDALTAGHETGVYICHLPCISCAQK